MELTDAVVMFVPPWFSSPVAKSEFSLGLISHSDNVDWHLDTIWSRLEDQLLAICI